MEYRDNYSFHPEDLLIFIASICSEDEVVQDIKILRDNSNWDGLKTYWNENIKKHLKEILIELFADISNYDLNEAWKLNKDYQKHKILEIFTDIISIFVPDSYFWGESLLSYDFDELYNELKQIDFYTPEEMIKMIEYYVNPFPENIFNCDDILQNINIALESGMDKNKLESIIVNYIRTGKDTSKEFDCGEYYLDK